jgi:predicted RNase H-like HicB family nuclease
MVLVRNEFTAIIVPAEEGGYWAYCPEVPGANGQGETIQEVKEDLVEAIGLMLEVLREEALRGADPASLREIVTVG